MLLLLQNTLLLLFNLFVFGYSLLHSYFWIVVVELSQVFVAVVFVGYFGAELVAEFFTVRLVGHWRLNCLTVFVLSKNFVYLFGFASILFIDCISKLSPFVKSIQFQLATRRCLKESRFLPGALHGCVSWDRVIFLLFNVLFYFLNFSFIC